VCVRARAAADFFALGRIGILSFVPRVCPLYLCGGGGTESRENTSGGVAVPAEIVSLSLGKSGVVGDSIMASQNKKEGWRYQKQV